MKPLKVVEPLVVWNARRDSGGRCAWPEAWVSGLVKRCTTRGLLKGKTLKGMMMILFGPGEMQLFTEKKPLEI